MSEQMVFQQIILRDKLEGKIDKIEVWIEFRLDVEFLDYKLFEGRDNDFYIFEILLFGRLWMFNNYLGNE